MPSALEQEKWLGAGSGWQSNDTRLGSETVATIAGKRRDWQTAPIAPPSVLRFEKGSYLAKSYSLFSLNQKKCKDKPRPPLVQAGNGFFQAVVLRGVAFDCDTKPAMLRWLFLIRFSSVNHH